MNYNRFIPLFIPFVIFLFFELPSFNPEYLYLSLVFIFLSVLYSGRQLVLASVKKEKWYNIVLLPIYLSFSVVLLSAMIPTNHFFGKLSIQFLFIFVSILLYYYFKFIYYYLINHSKYSERSLEYFSSYANFLSVYLISSAVFGFQAFLNIPIWTLMILILFFLIMIVYEVMWINNISKPQAYFYMALVCLAVFELAWAISFLTLSFYILGLLIAIVYYVLIGLVRFYLLEIINKKIIKTYLLLGSVSILIVLLTSNWI